MNDEITNIPKIRFKGYTEDWEQRKLGEVARRVTRKNKELDSTRPLTISAQEGLIDQNEFFNKTVASGDLSGYYLVKNGEFAYNKSYSNGYPWGAIKRLNRYDMGVLSTLYIIFKPIGINSEFLEKYYDTNYWHKEVSKYAAEGARNHGLLNIAASDFFETEIIIPSNIEEQQKIGSFFKTFDDTIALHQRELDLLRKTKQTYLQKMFPKAGEDRPEIRFAGFTEPWEQRKLKEITERVRGNDGRMDLPTLTISAGSGWLDQRERFSGNIAGKEQKNYTLLKKGQLSYNHGNSKLAKYGAVFELKTYNEALVPRVYHSFGTNELSNPNFIEYMFATKRPDKELAKLVSSGARMDGLLNINFDEFMGINVSIPSVGEQKKIGSFFEQLDDTIALHQRNLNVLKEMKKSLLRQMFV